MGETVTNLKVRFGADTKNFKQEMESGKTAINQFTGTAKSSFSEFAAVFGINFDKVEAKLAALKKSFSAIIGAIAGAIAAGQAKAASDMAMAVASETAAAAHTAETISMAANAAAAEALAAAEAAEAAANAAGTGATELHTAAAAALEAAIVAEATAISAATAAFEAQTLAIASATAAGTTFVTLKEQEIAANEAATAAALANAAGTTATAGASKAAAVATNIWTVALRILKIALISTGVGALVVLLGSLVAYFTRSSEGAGKVKVALAAMGAVVNVLLDRVMSFGKAMYQVLTGDFKGAAESLTRTFTGFTEELEKEYTLAQKLRKEIGQLAKDSKLFEAEREAGQTRIMALRERAKDIDLAPAERLKAIKEANAIEERLAEKSLALAEKEQAAALDQLDAKTGKLKLDEQALALIEKIKNGTISAADAQAEVGKMTLSDADLKGKLFDLVDKIVNREKEQQNIIQTRLRLQKSENTLRKEILSQEQEGIKANANLKEQQAANDKKTLLERTQLILDAADQERKALKLDFDANNISSDKYLAELDKLNLQTEEKIKAIRQTFEEETLKKFWDNVDKQLPSIKDIKPKITFTNENGNVVTQEVKLKLVTDNNGGKSLIPDFDKLFEGDKLEKSANKVKLILGDLKHETIEIGSAINEAMNNLAVSFGENLGLMIAGAEGAKSINEIFGSVFGELLVNVGKAAIAAGTGFLAIAKMFQVGIASPGAAIAAIAAGVAMVAIGSAFKAATSSAASSSGGTYSGNGVSYDSTTGVGGSGATMNYRSAPIEIHLQGEFRQRGRDLAMTVDEYHKVKKITT